MQIQSTIADDLRSRLLASFCEDDATFNRVVRKHLEEYRAGRISLARFSQLRNNARGNVLQKYRHAV